MRHQEIIFGVTGQSFFYDPPEFVRPSGTPTVKVYSSLNDDDSATPESATSGSCSVDAINTTISVSAARGDRALTIAAGTPTPGRRYVLTAIDGTTEIVEVLAASGSAVTLRRPLANAFPSSSTFQGCRISIPVLDSWAADKSKLTDVMLWTIRTDIIRDDLETPPGMSGYRLQWSYTIGGVATHGASYVDLVRYQLKNTVCPLDVDNKYAGWLDRLPIDHQADQGCRLIAEAFDNVRLHALANAQVARRIRDNDVLSSLVIDQAVVVELEANLAAGAPVADQLDRARKVYDGRFAQLITEPKVPIDQVGGGAGTGGRRIPVFRR